MRWLALPLVLSACAGPQQSETRCPPLQSYSAASQTQVRLGLEALEQLEAVNERDIDILPVQVRGPIKQFYTSGAELRRYINDYGLLRAQCRSLAK